MREEHKKSGTPSKLNPSGLSIVPGNVARAEQGCLSPRVVQCLACGQQTDYKAGAKVCEICGTGLSSGVAESNYSGYEPNLLSNGHEVYSLKPTMGTVSERRHPTIPCRNVKACIKTETGSSVVVNVVNISRGGLCFTGGTEFCPGAPITIATHYIEGGHNIYQGGRIAWVQFEGSDTLPNVYAVEFSREQPLSANFATSGTQL